MKIQSYKIYVLFLLVITLCLIAAFFYWRSRPYKTNLPAKDTGQLDGLFSPVWIDAGAGDYLIQGAYIVRVNGDSAEIIDHSLQPYPLARVNGFLGCKNGVVYFSENGAATAVQHISGFYYNFSEFDLRFPNIYEYDLRFPDADVLPDNIEYYFINGNVPTVVNSQGYILFQSDFYKVGDNPKGNILIYCSDSNGFLDLKGNFRRIYLNTGAMDSDGFQDGYLLMETGALIGDSYFTQFPTPTRYETRYTYISEDNQILKPGSSIEVQPNGSFYFNNAKPFSEGLAAVQVGQLWGYIDTSGAFIIEPQYLYAEPFQNGQAIVKTMDHQLGRITPSNERIGPWINIKGYSYEGDMDGLYCVQRLSEPYDQMLISETGENVLGRMYNVISADKGLWCLKAKGNGHRYFYFPDSKKTLAAWEEPKFRYHDSVVVQYNESDLLLNRKTGEQLFCADEILEFREGLAPFRADDLWGYIDENGTVVFSPQFHQAGHFSHGAAVVSAGGTSGVIANPLIYSNIAEWDVSASGRAESLGMSEIYQNLSPKSALSGEDIEYLIDQINSVLEIYPWIPSTANFHFDGDLLQAPVTAGQFCDVLFSLADQRGMAVHRFVYPYNVGDDSTYCDSVAFCAAVGILDSECSDFSPEETLSGLAAFEMVLHFIEVML